MRKYLCVLLSVCALLTSCVFLASCEQESEPFIRYELVCEYRPEDRSLTGTAKVCFENPYAPPLEELVFFLYPNSYRSGALFPAVAEQVRDEVYYLGESYGEIAVSSVHGAVSWEVKGEDENLLIASLETPLLQGDSVVLDIGFTTRLANAKHRLGVAEKTVNLGGFYPLLCPLTEEGFRERIVTSVGSAFVGDCAEYLFKLTLPKEYKASLSGEVLEESSLESKKKYTATLANAREVGAVLSKDFRTVEGVRAGKRVEYCYLTDEAPQKTLSSAMDALGYYSSLFGEYAYGRYAFAETELASLGVEYTTFSMLCEGLKKEEKTRAVAKEVAKQWWYSAVGSDRFLGAWQDEGLAEYSAVCYLGAHGAERTRLVAESFSEYQRYAKTYLLALGWVDRRMARPLTEFLSEYEYRCVSLHKAVIMFEELRNALGEKKFLSGLRKYYAENKYKVATVENLVGAYERIGVTVGGFFDGFLQGKEG